MYLGNPLSVFKNIECQLAFEIGADVATKGHHDDEDADDGYEGEVLGWEGVAFLEGDVERHQEPKRKQHGYEEEDASKRLQHPNPSGSVAVVLAIEVRVSDDFHIKAAYVGVEVEAVVLRLEDVALMIEIVSAVEVGDHQSNVVVGDGLVWLDGQLCGEEVEKV